jgi:hypothetical protein
MPTLVVEDGTIVSNANTYYSIASANNYFSDRGITSWAIATTDNKSYALIKSFQYMNTLKWDGIKSIRGQENSWPRIGMSDEDGYVIDSDTIPIRLKWAQSELAYRYLTEEVEPDIAAGESSVIKEKVDVIEITYSSGKSVNKTYQRVDSLLNPFLKYGGSSCVIPLVRG